MENVLFRPTLPGDEEQLKQIWAQAYHGDTACADLFFKSCYRPGGGIAAEIDGALCSAIYLMDGFVLRDFDAHAQTVTYLYALGTPEQFRGQGLGGRTIWRSGVEGYLRGSDLVCFLPASAGLSLWYQDILGAKPVFFHRAALVTSGDAPEGKVRPISPPEYAQLREQLLAGQPHAECPPDALGLQHAFCRLYGGGFYALELEGQTGICALDREDDRLTIRELLAPQSDPTCCARLLLSHLDAQQADVRTPAFWHPDFGRVVSDCVWVPGGTRFPKSPEQPYWGIALD